MLTATARGDVIKGGANSSTMNDLLADTIGSLTNILAMCDALEFRLFGEGSTASADQPRAPMPDAMQWRVNNVAVGAADINARFRNILDRL